MKSPFWGKCCAVAGTALVGTAVLLQTAGHVRAADPAGTSAYGPDVAPLNRASDGSPSALDYNLPPGVTVTSEKIGSSTRNNLRPPALVPNAPAAPIPAQPVGTSPSAPGALPLVSGPVPTRAIDSRATPTNSATINSTPSNNVASGEATQTAFRQYYQQRNDAANMDQPPMPTPYGSGSSIMRSGSPADPNTAAGLPPSIQAPVVPVAPPTPSEGMNGVYAPVRQGGPGSTCASCQGGGACGQLPPGAGDCPNCGGWKPGSCRPCDPNGSCILQRLGCMLSKPYPDISNGCLDFCHSWIWHEDDFWLFSDHKCVPPGCGPYPYGGCPTDGMGKGIQCGCGNCGPCIPPPDLYFSADALVLTREDTGSFHILGTGAGGTELTTNQLGFDWRVGPAITAGYRPTPKDAWEVTYFGLQDFTDTETLLGPGASIGGPASALGLIPNFNSADTLDVTYSSTIENGEINYLWHPYPQSAYMWLVGFRYFQLNEELNELASATGGATGDYDIRTVNNLYGLQLGLRLQHRFCDRFCMDGSVKGGVYRADSVQRQVVVNSGEAPLRDTDVSDQHWAYVAESGFNANYYLCRNWSVTAGYNVLWVGEVALAPDQLDFTNNAGVSGTTLNHGGSVFMHGAHLGVSCRW